MLQGGHVHGTEVLSAGAELISGDDLVALHGREKFEFIADVCCADPALCTAKECQQKRDVKVEDKKK